MTDLCQVENASTGFELSLRPEEPCDREFLARLYASTREDELLLTGWSSEQQAAFLSMQFNAQTTHYARVYASASRSVVLVDGVPAGRLYVFEHAGDVRIVDISLLPQYRGLGFGTKLLQSVVRQADSAGMSVSLNVAVLNPARRLYVRLGFKQFGDGDGLYLPMRRNVHAALN